MIVKVEKKESIIVKAMIPKVKRYKKDRPVPLTVLFNFSCATPFCKTVSGDNPFSAALGKDRNSGYFRCVCNGDPNIVLPQIISEIPEDEVPRELRSR